jgi:hypothetical protein
VCVCLLFGDSSIRALHALFLEGGGRKNLRESERNHLAMSICHEEGKGILDVESRENYASEGRICLIS